MKHLIKIESTPHGVLGVRHAGLDQQYCEAGEQVILKWQPDAKWGLQEAHYTDEDGNVTAIDLTRVKMDGKDVVVFTMPAANITIGGTFKRFVIDDWAGFSEVLEMLEEKLNAVVEQQAAIAVFTTDQKSSTFLWPFKDTEIANVSFVGKTSVGDTPINLDNVLLSSSTQGYTYYDAYGWWPSDLVLKKGELYTMNITDSTTQPVAGTSIVVSIKPTSN